MEFRTVFDEAIRLWRSDGGVWSAIRYVDTELASATDDEFRGLALSLLSRLYKRAGDQSAADKTSTEAMALVKRPDSVAEVVSNALDICVETNQVERGLVLAQDMKSLLDDHPEHDVQKWAAPILHNVGRLLTKAGDIKAAIPKLLQSVELFAADNCISEAAMVRVSLAKALFKAGDMDGAEELCKAVKQSDVAASVLLEANLVLSSIARERGDIAAAQRFWDKAAAQAGEVVGKHDMRVFLEILLAKADLDSARGDTVGAHQLQGLVRHWAAAGRIDGV